MKIRNHCDRILPILNVCFTVAWCFAAAASFDAFLMFDWPFWWSVLLGYVTGWSIAAAHAGLVKMRTHWKFVRAERELCRHKKAIADAILEGRDTAAQFHYEQGEAVLETMRKLTKD